jgi:hypothetical protein
VITRFRSTTIDYSSGYVGALHRQGEPGILKLVPREQGSCDHEHAALDQAADGEGRRLLHDWLHAGSLCLSRCDIKRDRTASSTLRDRLRGDHSTSTSHDRACDHGSRWMVRSSPSSVSTSVASPVALR